MSNSTDPATSPRVVRTQKPKGKLTKHNYRKRALGPLLIDFKERCAYSLKHLRLSGGETEMEIDHFDPRLKTHYIQVYQNLFLSTGHCNRKKGTIWPDAAAQARGVHFLNCCEEQDYGVHIFEDPNTHEVVGVTPAGKFHVTILDLNAEDLVSERKLRSEMIEALTATPGTIRVDHEDLRRLIEVIRKNLELMIPEIPLLKPPGSANPVGVT